MKHLIFTIILLHCLFFCINAQVSSDLFIKRNDELKEKYARSKGESDTIFLQAIYQTYGKNPWRDEIIYLKNNKLLSKGNLYVSAIGFSLINDTTMFYMPLKEGSDDYYAKVLILKPGDTILIRAVLFKNMKEAAGKTFMVVDDWTLQENYPSSIPQPFH